MPAAANTVTPETEKANKTESPARRANPVALEVLVSVTGARANNGGARELFSEETQTVLVFRDGGVIRLAAPVALGQLLFLTNKGSNAEVVCQVLNARAYGPTGAYVELQFTEEKADFWGVSFSAEDRTGTEFSRKEQVEAQQTTESSPGAVVERHKAEDVDQLKKEVEALRKQLLELEKKRSENAPAAAAMAQAVDGFVPASVGAVGPVPTSGQASAPSGQAATGGAGGQGTEAPLMPAATQAKEPGRAVVGMSLPMGKPPASSTKDAAEELLPKPELDFSQMPVEMVNGVRSAYRARHAEFKKVMAPALVVLVLVLAVAAWMAKPWKYFAGLKSLMPVSTTVKPGKPSAAVNKPVEAPGKPTNTVGMANAGIAKEGSKSPVEAGGEKSATETKPTAEPVTPEAASAKNATEEPKKSVRTKGKSGKAEGLGAGDGNAGLLAVNDAPVQPAKLIKAANPVYPPDAMRGFITGDVRAEVVIEADGRIGEIKVLSGPKPLREAAVEALRQYQYAPATQAGKGVASKVTTTVKFWFNP